MPHHVIVSHQRSQPERVAPHADPIQAGHARDIDQSIDARTLAALDLDDQVGRTSHDSRSLAILREQVQCFAH